MDESFALYPFNSNVFIRMIYQMIKYKKLKLENESFVISEEA